jgi:hypothetical protein
VDEARGVAHVKTSGPAANHMSLTLKKHARPRARTPFRSSGWPRLTALDWLRFRVGSFSS